MSNIIGYWDDNGFPDLVPRSERDKEVYIKKEIVRYMKAADGTGNNKSIYLE